jgi:thiol-disulfide isomerase/thioredoxin
MPEDTTSLVSCWDGYRKITINHDHKGILIDSFKNDPRPFRVVNSPFFTKTKSLIEYVLETDDSIKISFNEMGDSIQYNINIYDTVVEVIGNRMVYNSPQAGIQKGSVSKYRIWIDKSNDLPYRFERDMPHDKSTEESYNVRFNVGKLENFNATEYFPTDYEIREFIRGATVSIKSQLEGKPAPDWILQDINNDSLALNSLKGKVVMIQFTSVSCGPCQASVPFLNLLQSEYDQNQFDFVAIEAYNQNSNVLKNYRNRTNMTYRFLMSNRKVTKNYQIEAVPTFIILDEDRVIRKVIRGYRTGSTDSMIHQSINSLL